MLCTLYIFSKKKKKSVFRWIGLLLDEYDDPSPTRRERRAHFIQLIDLFRPSHSPVLFTIPSILGNKFIIFLFFFKLKIAGM